MTGYNKQNRETEDVIFYENGVKWIKTHDLATVSQDGHVRITGRIKRIYFKMGPNNIQVRVYPMRIEEAVTQCQSVRGCAVVGVKDDVTAYRTIAYIILTDEKENADAARAEIDALCREKLPESHIPDEYVFVKSFPLTRAGKVDYRTLENGGITS